MHLPLLQEKTFTIILTRECNLRCPFCPVDFDQTILSMENLRKGIEGAIGSGYRRFKFTGGEPFLEPDLLAAGIGTISEDLRGGVFRIEVVTNGTLLNDPLKEVLHKGGVSLFVSFFPGKGLNDLSKFLPFPDVTVNFLITPDGARDSMKRIEGLVSMGFSSFNLLPAFYVEWQDEEIEDLKAFFQGMEDFLVKRLGMGEYLRVRNITRRGDLPLFGLSTTLDTDGKLYSSNLVLTGLVDGIRDELISGDAVSGLIKTPPPHLAHLIAKHLKETLGEETLKRTGAVDSLLTGFVRRITPHCLGFLNRSGTR